MSDNSCKVSVSAPVQHKVEVVGLELISHSANLTRLFDASQNWILSLWADKNDEIKTITIYEKFIGRNEGFILDVNCTNSDFRTTFYAKLQTASMDTVLIHHILKSMKCGPDRFHVVLLETSYYHGVITEGVKGWNMASYLTRSKKNELLNEKKQISATTFLLTLLVELGQFGNIPNNRGNWGFVGDGDDSVPYPHMSLIDFSRGRRVKYSFSSSDVFIRRWKESLEYLYNKWEPVCGPIEDLQLFRDRTKDLRTSFLRDPVIEEQVQHFPFLQSKQAFTAVLQSACDASALWLHEAVQRARAVRQENSNNNVPSTATKKPVAYLILTPFLHVPEPDVTGLDNIYEQLIDEYLHHLDEWNYSVSDLYQWFPFANKNDLPSECVNASTDPAGDGQ